MQLKKATRKQLKLKIGIRGSSGSGKTYSSLLMAYGMTGDRNKVAIIDTENDSANYYSHLGDYNVLSLQAPYSPERYIDAINVCMQAGVEVIIIDSISHEYDGPGGILDIHGAMTGNSYINRGPVKKRHKAMIDKILLSPVHFILCGRRKQQYEMVENSNGKKEVQKMGMEIVQLAGLDYELGISFDIDFNHYAKSWKDRTSLFIDKPEFIINEETGKKLIEWANQGDEPDTDSMQEENTSIDQSLFDKINEEAGTIHIADRTIKTWNKLLDTPREELDKQASNIKLQLAKSPLSKEDKEVFYKFVDAALFTIKQQK